MGSHQLIAVPDYNWIIITLKNLKWVALSEVITLRNSTNGGHVVA